MYLLCVLCIQKKIKIPIRIKLCTGITHTYIYICIYIPVYNVHVNPRYRVQV